MIEEKGQQPLIAQNVEEWQRNPGVQKSGNIINLNDAIIEQLSDLKLTAEHLFVLECMYNETYDLLDKYDKNFTLERALNNYQYLERKDLLIQDPSENTYYIITVDGKALYESLLALSVLGAVGSTPFISQKKLKDSFFDEWWNTYPATANWEYEGRKFFSGRSLRSGTKAENKKAYLRILNEGSYTHRELVLCLEYEISAKKKHSLETNTNNLQYMKGSITYLNNREFENFIELIRSGAKIEESGSNYELG